MCNCCSESEGPKVKFRKTVKTKKELADLVLQKQSEREEGFIRLQEEFRFSEGAAAIVALSTEVLISKLQSRSVKALDVFRAYIAKALIVNMVTNSITEFIPQAKQWAKDLDNLIDVQGPLHGIPVTVSDDFDVEGLDSSLGYAKFLYTPATKSAAIVEIFRSLGAIPFAKTNVSQGLFSMGSENPIFRQIANPVDVTKSAGGSNAGAAATVALGATVFAVGTDMIGCLRVPSHFMGIPCLKATHSRLASKGVVKCCPTTLLAFDGVPGIVAKTAKTLTIVYRELLTDSLENDFDPCACPSPWNEKLFSSKDKLKFGFFTNLPFFPTVGNTSKTVMDATKLLISKGHEVVEFDMIDDLVYLRLIRSIIKADGGEHFRELFKNEQIETNIVKELGDPGGNPCSGLRHCLRSIFCCSCCCCECCGDKGRRERFISQTGREVKTVADLMDKLVEKEEITKEILNRMDKVGIDLILSPVFPFSAIKSSDTAPLTYAASIYTIFWNLVNFPAGTVPFGLEEPVIELETIEEQGDNLLKIAKENFMQPSRMPISVQIIARPYKEELILRALVELENAREEIGDTIWD